MTEETEQEARVRPECPFYGFARLEDALMDSRGNQCALAVDSFSPCRMEAYKKESPCWEKCFYNTLSNVQAITEIIEDSTVFPNEMESKTNRGVPMSEWYRHIMHKTELSVSS